MISFGPVPSRRLGKSLGINNIISPKACSYGCIYCQVGKTSRKSIKREAFFKPESIYDNVIQHIKRLSADNYPDYLTFVSNGEPTLDINLGSSIMLLKETGIPVAVITNASLLIYDSVKEELGQADWVSLKMDAGTDKTWNLINRPVAELNFKKHLKNILLFASSYKGILRTETMLVEGINDSEEELHIIAKLIKKINPGKAYLSVPIRPPAEKSVKPPDPEKLNRAWQIFTAENIKTELLTGFEGSDTGYIGNIYEDILNITAVHPLREDTLLKLLEKDNADYQVVESLINQKLIRQAFYKGKKFYLREYHIN
ncbi:MAG TPA: radical SAM protein [Bacteroidales bacterium]|jgi:wyosine [tRNA(Phe)-imidazoG37] synthetase (radical SAM superfamily)|nr:radical SAM protein [Bacteroidales bacterium]HOX73996.1 radical SAM protein [Bacteroidales bacterium]HPM87695.1 radical SAM protein [Bacteroidales bacterium]HQM69986.1 radical SAM protein [Bacteroidales bacterium]